MFFANVLSIDIGSCNTKIIVGRQQQHQVLIREALMFPTPQDSFHDGRISDALKLKDTIHTHLEKNGVKVKQAICTVESPSVITRELVLPLLKKPDMDKMVSFEIEQYLPIMLSEYVIEYKILEEFMEDNAKKARILVAALPRLMAEGYLHLLQDLKLKPIALDMNSNAISKLFTKEMKINNENYSLDKTAAIIDLGYHYMNINIIAKGIPQFNRIIPLGGKDIDMNIANTFNISFEDAEAKKISDGNLAFQENTPTAAAVLNEMIQTSIDGWIMEIQRIFQYYTSRSTGNKIDEIYFYGGSSKLKGLSSYLNSVFNIPASKIEAISQLKIDKKLSKLNIEDFLNAAGAIIRR